MAERACQLTERKDPEKLLTLAAAYAENGHFADAMETTRKALDLSGGNKALAAKCQQLTAAFKAAKPWRQGKG